QRLHDRQRLDLSVLGGDEVAPLVAAGLGDGLHAGVVAPGGHRGAVLGLLRLVRALAGELIDLVHDAALGRAHADEDHGDPDLAPDGDLAQRRRVRVAAIGEDHHDLAALLDDLVLPALAHVLPAARIERLAVQRIAAVAAPADLRAVEFVVEI